MMNAMNANPNVNIQGVPDGNRNVAGGAANGNMPNMPTAEEVRTAAASAREATGTAEPDAEPESLVGKEVHIQGLTKGAQYNGKMGRVLAPAGRKPGEDEDRYVVSIYMGEDGSTAEISVKQRNMQEAK